MLFGEDVAGICKFFLVICTHVTMSEYKYFFTLMAG